MLLKIRFYPSNPKKQDGFPMSADRTDMVLKMLNPKETENTVFVPETVQEEFRKKDNGILDYKKYFKKHPDTIKANMKTFLSRKRALLQKHKASFPKHSSLQ